MVEQAMPNILVHAIPDPLEASPEHPHHLAALSFRSKKPPSFSLSPRFHPPRDPLPRNPAKVDPWAAVDREDPEAVDSDPIRAAVLSLGIRTADDPFPVVHDRRADPDAFLPMGSGFSGGFGVRCADAATPATGLAH